MSKRLYPCALTIMLVGALAASAASHALDASPLTLRLVDLPQGWRVGDDSGCGQVGLESAPPEVVELVARHRPYACGREFNRVWGTAPPFYLESVAMTFADSGGARDALAAAQPVVRYMTALDGARFVRTSPVIGDASTGFSVPRAYLPGPQPSPAAVVVWRSGDILSIV